MTHLRPAEPRRTPTAPITEPQSIQGFYEFLRRAPFYFSPYNGQLQNYETGNTLSFSDVPSDTCLSGGNSQGVQGCNGNNAPAGSSLGFRTELVGIKSDGTFITFPDSWTWTDNFNGTYGGISTTYNFQPVDPESGTGGITITSVEGLSTPEPSAFVLLCLGLYCILIRWKLLNH